jgi:hypothetical protein
VEVRVMSFADISKLLERTKNYSSYYHMKTMQKAELKVIGGQELIDFYNNNNIDFYTLKDMALKRYIIEKTELKYKEELKHEQ